MLKKGTFIIEKLFNHHNFASVLLFNCVFDYSSDVNPMKVKIYDFQLSSYDSFALDLIFFLFTSIQNDVLKPNFKSFIMHYHTEFTNTLKTVNLPLNDYTFEK